MSEKDNNTSATKEGAAIEYIPLDSNTKDQVAHVLLEKGTPEQQLEAISYCSTAILDIRIESGNPSSYRLCKNKDTGELSLQGCFQYYCPGNGSSLGSGGFTWRNIPTVLVDANGEEIDVTA